MNSKSLDSYKDLTDKLSLRQAQVLKSLGWDINRVTGRVSELRKKGLIVYSADYYDTETDRTVNLWKLR